MDTHPAWLLLLVIAAIATAIRALSSPNPAERAEATAATGCLLVGLIIYSAAQLSEIPQGWTSAAILLIALGCFSEIARPTRRLQRVWASQQSRSSRGI